MTDPLVSVQELRDLALGEKAGFEDAQLEAAIRSASSIAYSALSAVHTLPLVTWGDDVRLNVAKVAAYNAMSARGFDPSNPADAVLKMNHDDAMQWFKDVAARRLRADVVDTSPPATRSPRVISNAPRGYGRGADRYEMRRRRWGW